MKHKIRGRKFGRNTKHRKSLLRNLAISLIEHESVTTTVPKSKDIRPVVEKLVTLSKTDTLHNRRQAFAFLGNNANAVQKLFSTLAERYQERPGGYTRIIRTGFRKGDCAPMSVIQFV